MKQDVIDALIRATTLRDALDVLADETVFFQAEQGEYDEDIVQYCEDLLQTGRLSAKWVDGENGEASGIQIRYGDKVLSVPFTDTPSDRHFTFLALNRILAPDFEVRLCIDSDDIESLTFLPLSTADWKALEDQYGDGLKRRFYRIEETPRLFVDDLDGIKPPEVTNRKLDSSAKKRLRTPVQHDKQARAEEASKDKPAAAKKTLGSDPGPPPRRPSFRQWTSIAPVHPQMGAVITPIASIGTIAWAILAPDESEYWAYPLVLAPIMTLIAWLWMFKYRRLARTGAAVLGRITYVRKSDNLQFAVSPRVGYAYEVNGRERKREIQIPQKPKGGIEAGMGVWVLYDPTKPDKSAMWGVFDKP